MSRISRSLKPKPKPQRRRAPRPSAPPKVLARRASDARSVRSRQVVLDAAVDLFTKHGYSGFSVNAIVRQTGIAKTTIYRHWPTQSHLLVDVIARISDEWELPDTGSLRRDLIQHFVRGSCSIFNDNKQRALLSIPNLIHTAQTEPGLEHMVEYVLKRLFGVFRIMLERGRSRGEVRTDRDLDTIIYILFGALFVRRGFLDEDLTERQIASIVDTVMEGIAPPPSGRRASR